MIQQVLKFLNKILKPPIHILQDHEGHEEKQDNNHNYCHILKKIFKFPLNIFVFFVFFSDEGASGLKNEGLLIHCCNNVCLMTFPGLIGNSQRLRGNDVGGFICNIKFMGNT